MSEIVLLIPHYNAVDALYASVKSLDESIAMDLLVVDDGSVAKPDLNYLEALYTLGKVYVVVLAQNQGIERALNHGLRWIETKNYAYIGRLDCGDFCKKDKFTKQLKAFREDNELLLLGTWANVIDEKGTLLYELKHPIKATEIGKKMYLNNCFVHPSVVFRKTVLERVGYYPENYPSAEDFAYFFEIMKVGKVANYPEILLDYVVSPQSISTKKRKEQIQSRIHIIRKNFYFGIYPLVGILRNVLLLSTSRAWVEKIKSIIRK